MSPSTLHSSRPPLGIRFEQIFRLSVAHYHQMARAGILTTEDRVELLEGLLVRKHQHTTTPNYPWPKPRGFIPLEDMYRLSVEQYHEMIERGILNPEDRVELLDGLLVCKMSKKTPHSTATRLARRQLEKLTPNQWFVDSQEPITLSDSEPEPDVGVIRGDPHDYRDRHPGPSDVGLLVEVSETTLDQDQGVKKDRYARAGVAIYWILNLIDRQVEVYSNPSGPTDNPDYATQRIYTVGEAVPFVLDGQELGQIPVADLLP